MKLAVLLIHILFFTSLYQSMAQDTSQTYDKRAELNSFLSRGSINVNLGYIQYPYSNNHLVSNNYLSESVKISHLAARVLLGYRINKVFSVHYSVMRAAIWPSYRFRDTLGNIEKHGVAINQWGLTLKSTLPVNEKTSIFLESGIGLLSRNGFTTYNSKSTVTDQNYLTVLSSAGITHRFSPNWDAVFMTTFSPASKVHKQPYTIFASLGFIFHMHQLSKEVVAKNASSPFIFPKQFLQIGAASNIAGFTANKMFSIGSDHIGLPIFWKGVVQAQTGGAITFQKNVFHTKRVFSLDWGTSLSFWQTEINKDQFVALSVFPIMRFWFLRNNLTDNYFVYSIVGPSLLSKEFLDDHHTGANITYQDYMGFGTFFGKQRKLNAELKIVHYSNGNVFSINPGVDIPLMMNFGYAF